VLPDCAIELVEVLFDYQYDMYCLRQGPWGMNHLEFLFLEAARIIESHPELRPWTIRAFHYSMLQRFENNISQRPRPKGFILQEFILFFVHRSRWPEFASLATALKGTAADLWHSNLIDTWSAKIEGALQDSWEDREFFSSFGVIGGSN
jgi:hypothetical protein